MIQRDDRRENGKKSNDDELHSNMYHVVKNIGCVEIHRCGDTKNRENSETKRHGKARRELAST